MSFEETKGAFAALGIEERRVTGDRRRNPFRQWRRIVLGGLPVVVVDRQEAAQVIVEEALKRRNMWRYPAYLTSTNGEVTYRENTTSHPLHIRELNVQAENIRNVRSAPWWAA